MAARYFEDFTQGERFVSASATLSEALITEFARDYDPQPFHIDRHAAKESHFGGLIASGFQTMALAFRLFYQEDLITACSMGSPGMDEVRWLKPVIPGDTLHTEAEVRSKRESGSKPDRGILHMDYTVKNHSGEAVMTFTAIHILARRPG